MGLRNADSHALCHGRPVLVWGQPGDLCGQEFCGQVVLLSLYTQHRLKKGSGGHRGAPCGFADQSPCSRDLGPGDK